MNAVFCEIINMSIYSSAVIALVMLARIFLFKSPKFFSYCLWLLPAIRLIVPNSFFDRLSINKASEIIEIGTKKLSAGSISAANMYSKLEMLPDKLETDTVVSYVPYIWIIVASVLIIYTMVEYVSFARKLIFAVRAEDNIYKTDVSGAPFAFGIVKRKIYIPNDDAFELSPSIIEHEKVHVKRFDCAVRIIGKILTAIYWFNPLVHIAYRMMCRDQEMSCDEKVMKKIPKAEYMRDLLSHILKNNRETALIGFGTSNIRKRIRNIQRKGRKTTKRVIVLSVIICLLVGIVGCTNAFNKADTLLEQSLEEFDSNIDHKIIFGSYPALQFFEYFRSKSKSFDEFLKQDDYISYLKKGLDKYKDSESRISFIDELICVYDNYGENFTRR